MSIIYEALQKTQKNREGVTESEIVTPKNLKQPKQNRLLQIFLFVVLVSLFFVIGFYLKSYFTPAKTIKKTLPQPAFVQPAFHLDGVFLSSREKVAMINQQFLHVGDNIHNMQVVEIERDHVLLSDGKNSVRLK